MSLDDVIAMAQSRARQNCPQAGHQKIMIDAERAPGYIEIDDSGGEPVVRLRQPQDSFTLDQLRAFGTYLVTVADEAAAARGEPEVQDLARLISGSRARYLPFEEAVTVLARDLLKAGYRPGEASQ